jgi:hypothetical protein
MADEPIKPAPANAFPADICILVP